MSDFTEEIKRRMIERKSLGLKHWTSLISKIILLVLVILFMKFAKSSGDSKFLKSILGESDINNQTEEIVK